MVRASLLLFVSLLAGLTYYTTRVAPRWLRVSRLNVNAPGLAPEWRGLRVAHLSDFHLGAPGSFTSHLREAKSITLDYEPHVIALTGDFYDGGKQASSDGLFGGWPANVPVYAVMGNHDRRGPAGTLDRIRDELKQSGIRILDNEAVAVDLLGKQAWIAGVDDPHTFNSDVKEALRCVGGGEPVLLFLSHAPAVIEELTPGQASILLAGHTHGGQVRLLPSGAVPFVDILRKLLGAPGRPDGPVYRRWHWINGTVVLISDGLGVSSLPIRFRTRPHLILIELSEACADAQEACDDIERYVKDISPEHWLLRWFT